MSIYFKSIVTYLCVVFFVHSKDYSKGYKSEHLEHYTTYVTEKL